MEDARYSRLATLRRALIRAYALHVAWFAAMCAFVGWHWSQRGLQASVLLTLVTVPPVLYYTVEVHRLCRAVDPRSRTVGWVPVLITTLVLSPFESGLVLPLKNLLACNKLLRQACASTRESTDCPARVAEAPNDTSQPAPLGDTT